MNPQCSEIEMISLSALPSAAAHPTLLFYIHGSFAETLTARITHLTPNSPAYFGILNTLFEPYYSRLPNYKPSATCTPTAILATDWQHDELSGFGSYSNFQISPPLRDGEQEVRLDKDIEVLRYGWPERGIWFAGEHTAPFDSLGTVTGAWLSGEGVAKRLLEVYGMGRDEVVNGRPVADGIEEKKDGGNYQVGKGAKI